MHLGCVRQPVLWISYGQGLAQILPVSLAGLLNVRVNEEAGNGEASVHGKFGVSGSRSDGSLTSPVRVTE